MPTLARRTQRLTIRPLASKDYLRWKTANSSMLQQANEWDRKNTPVEKLDKAHFKEILKGQKKRRDEDNTYTFAVFLNETGDMIGIVSAMDVIRGPAQNAFLGYVIFNRYWGNGYGKEAVAAMIDIALRSLKIHRIEAGIEPRNRRSILLARSLGLRKEGLKRKAVFLRGRWVDLTTYSATCEDFRIKWKGTVKARLR